MAGKRLELTGQRFGRLLVTAFSGMSEKWHTTEWLCKCDCGNMKVISGPSLTSGNSQSCGCLTKERSLAANRTHGMTGTKIIEVWRGMIRRCTEPNYKCYSDYGGRGISVCKEWLDFAGFYKDMGETYRDGLTLERKDNDGNYCKDNCQWTTPKEQANNQRSNRIIVVNGESLTLAQACDKYGVPYGRASNRLRLGWPGERAVLAPKGEKLHG